MGTVTIVIADDQSDEAVGRARGLLERIALHDSNWSGAEFEIERGPFTHIDEQDGVCAIAAGSLFCKIISALEGKDGGHS